MSLKAMNSLTATFVPRRLPKATQSPHSIPIIHATGAKM